MNVPNELRLGLAALLPLLLLAKSATAAPVRDETTLRTRLTGMVARPDGLEANEVARRAQSTSFELRQKRQEVLAAAAAADQALVAWFPRLSVAARYARLSPIDAQPIGNLVVAPPGTATGPLAPGTPLINAPVAFPALSNATSLQASLQLPLLDYVLRIPSVQAAARHQREAACWSERAARRQLTADARVLYYSWARARLQAVVAEQALTQARGHLDSARHALDAGSAPKADLMRVQAQVAATELFLMRARNLEAVLAEQLRTAMHDTGAGRYEIGEDLRVELAPLALGALEPLVDEAWRGRMEPRILDELFGTRVAERSVARAGLLPRLDGFGDVVSADPNPRFFPQRDSFETTWDVGAQVSWSPNDLAVAALASRAGSARVEAVAAERHALHDRLRGEVMQALAAVREADFAVAATARGLDAAEESYRVRRDLYANGRATSIELTDAETDLTQARLNAVAARIDQRLSRVRFAHAVGRDGEKN
ncbi:MAG: TolC family protein [Polyangia bacterium]